MVLEELALELVDELDELDESVLLVVTAAVAAAEVVTS